MRPIKRSLLILAVAGATLSILAVYPAHSAPVKPPLDLGSLKPAAGNGHWNREGREVSIAGKLYDECVRLDGWLCWKVPSGYSQFETSCGISDDVSDTAWTLRILIDGDLVKSLTVRDGERPVKVSVPVNPGATFRLEADPQYCWLVKPQLLAGPAPRPSVKPVLEVVMGEPECKESVQSLGLTHKTKVAVPDKLQFYSCVILNNDNAVSPKIADRLKRFVEQGGGVVMTGQMPKLLVGSGRGSGSDISPIADWFGCSAMYSVTQSRASLGGNWPGVPASIATIVGKPLGTSFAKGTTLFRYQGDRELPMLGSPDEFCEIAGQWISETEGSAAFPAAFLHPYGKGSVYWQSARYDPNYPKLEELFRAGIWRAATGKNLQPGQVSSLGETGEEHNVPQDESKDNKHEQAITVDKVKDAIHQLQDILKR
jgi:hypothetical protein